MRCRRGAVHADGARRWLAGRSSHAGLAALAAGLALAPAPRPAAVATCAFAGAALAAARMPRLALLVAGLVLAGAIVGGSRLAAIDRTAAAAGPPGATVSGRAVLLGPPRPSMFGSSAIVRVESGRARGARVVARAGSELRWPGGGEVGTIVSISGVTARPARARDFDWPGYLRRR